MKIERRIITIQIDADEWKQIQREYEDFKYGKKKYHYNDYPKLDDFLDSIKSVKTNPAHKIDRKLGTY